MPAASSRSRRPLRPLPAIREPPAPLRPPSRAERAPPRAVPPLRAAGPAPVTPLMDDRGDGGGPAPPRVRGSRGGRWEM